MPPADCPNCGATLAKNADACPECGADEETGWNEDAYWQDLGVTDDEFDYDEFVEREFGEKERVTIYELHPNSNWASALYAYDFPGFKNVPPGAVSLFQRSLA
mgnify:CR=1 FL=1